MNNGVDGSYKIRDILNVKKWLLFFAQYRKKNTFMQSAPEEWKDDPVYDPKMSRRPNRCL